MHARAFARDVKGHIDAIAEKYIRPDEGTCEFAFMYLPTEGVYYELVCNRIGGDANPVDHAQKRRVFPVSPNSFYTYLLTLAQGFKGLQIEEHAREVMAYVADLNRDFARFKARLRPARASTSATRRRSTATRRSGSRGSRRSSSAPRSPSCPSEARVELAELPRAVDAA